MSSVFDEHMWYCAIGETCLIKWTVLPRPDSSDGTTDMICYDLTLLQIDHYEWKTFAPTIRYPTIVRQRHDLDFLDVFQSPDLMAGATTVECQSVNVIRPS